MDGFQIYREILMIKSIEHKKINSSHYLYIENKNNVGSYITLYSTSLYEIEPLIKFLNELIK